jgi:two-component system, OmpR family, phosphate regulon response regulator PhoB
MRQVKVLHTGMIAGGTARFDHSEMQIEFRHWTGLDALPLLDGSIWAFIDWTLPDISGLEVCRRLRCNPLTAQAHITMILPGDDLECGRSALRAGADDYVIGPVDRNTVLDRILSNKLDDFANEAARVLSVGGLAVDFASYQARWQGKPIPLMPNEFRLLRYLIEHPGRVFTRSQLITALGKQEQPVDERTVDVWVGRLRRALRAAGAGDMVRTVRSLGYVLDQP